MKKKICFLTFGCLFLLASLNSIAQSRVQAGVGLANLGINAAFEKPLPSVENLGVGLYGAYTRRNFSYGLGYIGALTGYQRTSLDVGVRGAYHLNELVNLNNDNIDLYGALGVGLRLYNYGNDYVGNATRLGLGGLLRAGANFSLSPTLGGFAEVGYGPSLITAGVTFDLGGER